MSDQAGGPGRKRLAECEDCGTGEPTYGLPAEVRVLSPLSSVLSRLSSVVCRLSSLLSPLSSLVCSLSSLVCPLSSVV